MIQRGERIRCSLVLTLLLLVITPNVYGYEPSKTKELNLTLYPDGFVDVEHVLGIDPTLARVNVTLFCETQEFIIAKDSYNLPLDYTIHGRTITVDVLGSAVVTLFYSTPNLTNKTGSLWRMSLVSPVDAYVKLPVGASIINLSPLPLIIRTLDSSTNLIMPAGEIVISYVIGIVGTKVNALAVKNEAEEAIEESREEGINVEAAERLLQQAREAFEQERYSQAELYANQAKTQANEHRNLAQEAKSAIFTAAFSIETASDEGRTSLLNQAEVELEEAWRAYEAGEYDIAKELATQALLVARLSKTVPWYENAMNLSLAGLGVTTVCAFLFLRRRTGTPDVSEPQEVGEVGKTVDGGGKPGLKLDDLLNQFRHLRTDDREVIRYIYEKGGGVFASELRKHFDLPKSSAWRMIRRLEKEGVVETRTVGRETYVQLRRPDAEDALTGMEPAFQTVPAGSYYEGQGSY